MQHPWVLTSSAVLVLACPHRSLKALLSWPSCTTPVSSGRTGLTMPSYGLVKWKDYSWCDTRTHK